MCVLRPLWEFVCIDRGGSLKLGDDLGVFVEEDLEGAELSKTFQSQQAYNRASCFRGGMNLLTVP